MTAITSAAVSAMHAASEQGTPSVSTGNRVFPVRSLSEWQVRALKKLAGFGSLQPNWDSYGSPSIAESVLDDAVYLVSRISLEQVPKLRITPISGGGIQLEWEKGTRELAVEVRPDHSLEISVFEGDEPLIEDYMVRVQPAGPAIVEQLLGQLDGR